MATGPAYMNATPHHSKVRASLTCSSALFVAGEDITGKMEMECRAEKEVGIGLIMVELFAIQELNSRDHSATSTYIHTRRLFQGPGLPPSNAVHAHPAPGDPPLPPSHFPARRGITTFFFRFPIPISSPSSISFGSGLAKIRYEIRASVGVSSRGEKRLVTSSLDADVVQREDMDGTVEEHVIVGDNGKMYVRGKILSGRLVAGEQSCLELQVKNYTPKKTSGLTLTLSRSLRLHGAASNVPVQLSDSLFSETFRGAEYTMQPGTEGVANLVFKVPNAARVVKGGIRDSSEDGEGGRKCTEPLFEIQCILGVKINMGLGSKDIVFEMPVQLSHRAALPDFAPGMDPYPNPYEAEPVYHYHSPRAASPLSPPNPYFGRSPDPGSGSSSPAYPYMSPPTPASPYYQTPPQQPVYVSAPHTQGVWSPPPQVVSPIPYYLPNLNQPYYYPPPPVGLVPFAYPTRPSSAGAQPIHYMPTGLPDAHSHPVFLPPAHVPETELPVTVHQNISPARGPGPEEGKGERASRISHHLHTSTRARSMSPTSHRFPVSPPAPPAFQNTTPQRPHAPPVLSPRPLVSPANSFTAESHGPKVCNGTTRSDRVDLLERLVDPGPGDERRSVEEVLKELEQAEKEEEKQNIRAERAVDKTLPGPPVPSGKVQPKSKSNNGGLPRAMDVFGAMSANESWASDIVKSEDKPMKSVLRPSPMARRISTDSKGLVPRKVGGHTLAAPVSGLDALEKRLLQEVGTRKPDASERPTIFSLGFTLTKNTASVPPPLTPVNPHDSGPPPLAPVNPRDSAISELALTSASHGSPNSPQPRTGNGPVNVKEEKAKDHEAHKLRKAAKGRVADWLDGLGAPSAVGSGSEPVQKRKNSLVEGGPLAPSLSQKSVDVRSPSPVRTPTDIALNVVPRAEALNTNKVSVPVKATARTPPPSRAPLSNVDRSSKREEPKPVSVPKPPTGLSKSPVMSPILLKKPDLPPRQPVKKPSLYTSVSLPSTVVPASPIKSPVRPSPPQLKDVSSIKEELPEAKPLTLPPPASSPNINKAMRRLELPSSKSMPENKYDVRSARGGKGGIATSVAALWTSLAEEGSKETNASVRPVPIAVKKATNPPDIRPAVLDIGKSRPSPSAGTQGRALAPTNTPVSVPAPAPPPKTQEPRDAVKSTSAPATVVPSHATPQLSTTASLARPIISPSPRIKPPSLSPTLEEEASVEEMKDAGRISSPPPLREMAFGQARLKDLIKKYQQAAS